MADAKVLLITGEEEAEGLARSLRLALQCDVEVASTRRAGLAAMRQAEFSLVLMDMDPALAETMDEDVLYAAAGTATVLEQPLRGMGAPRVVRQVRAAMNRRAQEEARIRAAAISRLQGEMNASLTGLLLHAELALREADAAMEPKLRRIVQLAGDLRRTLQV